MISSVLAKRTGLTPSFALVSVLSLLAGDALAQTATDVALEPVVVTGSRFANDPGFSPIGATVISAEQIREAGASDVNQAIRQIGGVYGRQGLLGTQDYSLDLRGFGATSDQNMVIMLDGVRLSEKELATALLSSIPIDSVERIEIVRGGSSVLYGEGATGGTIQIITKRPQREHLSGSVVAEIGSYGHQELRASVAKGWDKFALDASISKQRSDNYRDNAASDQGNFSGGLQWGDQQGRVGVRVNVARLDSRLPGSLTPAEFNENPRKTNTPNDFGSYDVDRYTLFGERRVGAFDLAAELSQAERTAKGNFLSLGSQSVAKTRVTQFTPRLRHSILAADWQNELVTGLDLSNWSLNGMAVGMYPSQRQASQKSQAFYIRDEIVWNNNARVAIGARHESFDKDTADSAGNSYRGSQGVNAWDLQGSYALVPGVRVFAKTGQSYRIANVDEDALTPVSNQLLKPQISQDLEFGTTFGDANRKLTVRLFDHRLHNEIMYDPTAGLWGANSNLDATRRRGVELESNVRLNSQFTALANLQHVNATFTDGPNSGKEITLVPRNTASVRLNWQSGIHSAEVGVRWVDQQSYGGDFSNTCATKMPSFATVAARYALRINKWELAVVGSNLTARNYYSQAYGCQYGISVYPDPGRQLKLTARYDF